MNTKIALFAVMLSGCVMADPAAISELTAKQRWPWSAKVDIHFTVGAGDKADVELAATWDGHPEPLRLSPANGLTGRSYGLSDESGHVVWDPCAAGFTNALTGFKVTANAVSAADRTWLVIDLTDGSHEFFAVAPEGGWTADVYKESKMVFRRVEGRTFTMGYTASQRGRCTSVGGPSDWHTKKWGNHQVTLSDDYYLAIYRVTNMQAHWIEHGSGYTPNADVHKWRTGYGYGRSDYRGSPNAPDNVRWPDTGYRVTPNSLFGKRRIQTGNALVIDLPTEAQWENAMRNGTTTLWDVGGDADTITTEEFMAVVDRFVNFNSTEVGLKEASTLGFYDMYGRALELCLDIWRDAISAAETDPVGPAYSTENTALVARGMSNSMSYPNKIGWAVPAQRINYSRGAYRSGDYGEFVVRPCIHLNSVFE